MTRTKRVILIKALAATLMIAAVWPGPASSQVQDEQPQPATPAEPLTVAVLDFEAKMPGNDKLGSQISDTLTALLAGESNLRLVERPKLRTLLEEQELALTGMVSADDAVKVGKLVGARIIVTGRLFPLGSKLYLTSKVIGTETSLVEGVLVKDDASQDLDELLTKLAAKLGQTLKESGPKLVAPDQKQLDPVPVLIKSLKDRPKPTLAVRITEEHHSRNDNTRAPIDPAVQTEVVRLLTEAGFAVVDIEQGEAFDQWVKQRNPAKLPAVLATVDLVIAGEAMSEYSTRVGNLISCAARAEIVLIDRRSSKVRLSDRTTQRAVDLSENIAAKAGLQQAGRELGINLLRHFDTHLPAPAKHQVTIQFDRDRLAAMNLSLPDVIAAVGDRNPGIKLDKAAAATSGDGPLSVAAHGPAKRLAQLGRTIISPPDQPLVQLKDVAQITDTQSKSGD